MKEKTLKIISISICSSVFLLVAVFLCIATVSLIETQKIINAPTDRTADINVDLTRPDDWHLIKTSSDFNAFDFGIIQQIISRAGYERVK